LAGSGRQAGTPASPRRRARAGRVNSHLSARGHGILITQGPALGANRPGRQRVAPGPGWTP
jgi:hypothetical protein